MKAEDRVSGSTSVLVVGDWVVDEHWVVGKHRSATSNRTGRDHSRALHTEMCSVRSLCGAGQVATILQQARSNHVSCFDISGVGIWHPGDTDALVAMVDPQFNVGKTPHRLTSDLYPQDAHAPQNVRMYNLAGIPDETVANVGTIRALRIYENTPAGSKLRQRFDWEWPLGATDHKNIRDQTTTTLNQLFEHKSEIRHILVKDLRKGTVDLPLIRMLSEQFKDARWYISSKEWQPDWMAALKRARVELIVVPQTAARRAVARDAIATSWLTSGGVPSREALTALKKLGDEYKTSRIVVLPSDATILAFDRDASGEAHGFIHSPVALRETMPFTPMASVFFPALVAYLAVQPAQKARSFSAVVHDAVSFTQKWQVDEGQRLTRDNWTPGPAQILVLDDSPDVDPRLPSFRWSDASDQWDAAFSNLGIVSVPDPARPGEMKEEFQLWRGMTELDQYVACNPKKRLALSHVMRQGEELFRTPAEERRHRSVLFVDSPGSGKSFMVERLRKTLRMESKHYNITRLQNRNDLFACFQEIAAVRSDIGEPLLVFVDELNAKVNNQHIYDGFLEPLEDGKYVRSGSVGRIEPCLWILAGTEDPSRAGDSSKGLDLEQRLSHPVFHFREPGDDTEESEIAKVERVYVGVSCLLQRFPEVKRVSKRVLQAFRGLSGKVPREVRRFVWDFEEVQYSRVTAQNLPREWHRKYGGGTISQQWEHWGDEESL